MQELLDGFTAYLIDKQEKSRNTIVSYRRDIANFLEYLKASNVKKITDTDRMTIVSYLLSIQKSGKASATVSRSLASIRAFYSYIINSGYKMKDPTANIETPPAQKKEISILTPQEAEILVSEPKSTDLKGIRDKAMLELLYATGIKVSELVNLSIDDIDIKHGLLRCQTKTHERVVPIGEKAILALKRYIEDARPMLVIEDSVKFLFVNRNGTGLSRQGFWKLLKHYGKAAGIKKDITPYTIRHSFAMHLLENGADLEAIRQLLGHTNISATQIYSKIIDGHIKEVYQKAHPRA